MNQVAPEGEKIHSSRSVPGCDSMSTSRAWYLQGIIQLTHFLTHTLLLLDIVGAGGILQGDRGELMTPGFPEKNYENGVVYQVCSASFSLISIAVLFFSLRQKLITEETGHERAGTHTLYQEPFISYSYKSIKQIR